MAPEYVGWWLFQQNTNLCPAELSLWMTLPCALLICGRCPLPLCHQLYKGENQIKNSRGSYAPAPCPETHRHTHSVSMVLGHAHPCALTCTELRTHAQTQLPLGTYTWTLVNRVVTHRDTGYTYRSLYSSHTRASHTRTRYK